MSKISQTRFFSKEQVLALLNAAMGRTLLDVDSRQLFLKYEKMEKVTGLAGNIVEQSILGCDPDNRQDVDIYIDGVGYEIKTTGMVVPKDKQSPYRYECKEPVSVTAVSIQKIVSEEFESSNFWHKLEHLLWVYYWYKSETKVKPAGYKLFPLLKFQLFEFDETDKLRLKHDWLLVRDFLIEIHREYPTEAGRKSHYPLLSSKLRKVLLVIDTAPKYPNPPRFRLKRDFATEIAGNLFSKKKKAPLLKLPKPIMDYSEIDSKCEELNKLYSGKTFAEIADMLNLSFKTPESVTGKKSDSTDSNKLSIKNFAEMVVLKMFESDAASLNQIDDFRKIGLIAKSLPLDNAGEPKESMKMYTPDFKEWMSEKTFADSYMRDYFSEHQFLLIVYQYVHPNKNVKSPDFIKFVGFKRVYLTDEFIDTAVWKFWNDVRVLIRDGKLKVTKSFDRYGNPIMNPVSGTQKEAPNFPKEAQYEVFMRGSGRKSEEKYKTLELCGYKMLPQEIWLSKRVTYNLFKHQKI